jgi:uncharacterized protein (TIGR00251 family)
LIGFQDNEGKLSFAVAVVPRASRSEVVGEHAGALRIRLAAPPVEGAANEELIRLLAKLFSVPRRNVEIRAGERSKTKFVSITGGDSGILEGFGTK